MPSKALGSTSNSCGCRTICESSEVCPRYFTCAYPARSLFGKFYTSPSLSSIREILPPAFQDLHSLEWIKLANNDLKTLHYELMEPVLDSLMHIDLHSESVLGPNSRTNISRITFALSPSGNPLICDCELRWYRQWIDEEWNEIDAKGHGLDGYCPYSI